MIAWTRERLETLGLGAAPILGAALLAASNWPAAPETRASVAIAEEQVEAPDERAGAMAIADRAAARGEALAALEREIGALAAGEVRTPFEVLAPETPGIAARTEVPEEGEPRMTLTSVMSGGGGALCVINERVRREGDEAAPGWVVRSIDAAARSVTIEGPDGRKVTLTQRR